MSETIKTQAQQPDNPMGYGPMLPLIIKMSLPSMFSMLVQALYNIVDSMFVARLNQQALAAVSLVFPVQNLIIGVAVGTGIGVGSLVSRRLGQQDQKSANMAAAHGLLLGVFNWVVFAIGTFFLIKPFFAQYRSDPVLYEYALQYANIVLYGSVGIFLSVVLEKVLQGTGNMVDPMWIMLIGSLVNLVLDPIMIFGLLGCPAMGVAGAAIATVIGQLSGMAYAVVKSVGRRHSHRVTISMKGFTFNWRVIKDIYQVGLPSMVMQCIGSVMVAGMNAILIAFSQAAVSAFGIYFKLQSFIFLPVFGLTSGVMPIMGYSYGAHNRQRLMACLRYSIIIASAIMAVGMVVFWLFPTPLLQIFDADAELLRIGVPALRIISLSFLPAAIGIMMSTMFQAVGMGINSLIMSVLRQLVIILPAAYFLARLGVNYVWFSLPLAEGFSLVVSLLLYLWVKKTRLLPLDNQ